MTGCRTLPMSSRTAFHSTHLDLARGPAIPLTHAPRPGPPDAACADFDSEAMRRRAGRTARRAEGKMAVTGPQLARTCLLGFVFLVVPTLCASLAAAEQGPNDQQSAETSTTLGSSAAKGAPASQSSASYFSDAAQLLQAGPYHTDHSRLDDALARGAVDLLEADADANKSIEGQPVLADLRIGLESLGMLDIAKPDIATIHLGSDYRGSEDIVLFSFEHVPSSIVAIHRIGEKYEVLHPTVLQGGARGAAIRTLDVTGDGINEAIATYEEGGSAGELQVEVLRWVGGPDNFRLIFSMEASSWSGLPCRYRFVPALSSHNIEVTLPVVGTFDDRGPYQADTAL